MGSRFASSQHLDYCYHPQKIYQDDRIVYVPCGKCDGCLLHSANEWSQRVGNEIEGSLTSIFGTLTYNNHYLPTLVPLYGNEGNILMYRSDHSMNIRFNSVSDVKREDHIIINYPYSPIPINDYFRTDVINYASKRDIQLWLKLIRKSINEYFGNYGQRNLFRYFIISEIGPTTFRGHFHFLLFFQDSEIASFVIQNALYENWKMCDETLFRQYTHYCDSGCRGYVTNYLTSKSNLPRIYRENKEVAPFRLASKAPAIGYICFDLRQIFEDVSIGVIEYDKQITRLGEKVVLRYPKNFMSSVFPKCKGFELLSFSRILIIYGYLFREIDENGGLAALPVKRCSFVFDSSTFTAMSKCNSLCRDYGLNPFHYCFLLDMYYYKSDMYALKMWYLLQEKQDFINVPQNIFLFYSNFDILFDVSWLDLYHLQILENFFVPLGLDPRELSLNKKLAQYVKNLRDTYIFDYKREVTDILEEMVKMPKFNELTGNAPHII